MIQLDRTPKPIALTDELILTLTADYQKDNSKRVWAKDFITKALLEMSHYKCCYSECKLDEKSNYMEVEHFYAKSLFPAKVVEWENLLPSSKKCNGTKLNLDVVQTPIINPVLDKPKEHLYLKAFRFYGKSVKGENTLKHLGLNDRKHWVTPRAKVADEIEKKLVDIEEQLEDLEKEKTQNRLVRNLKALMKEGTKTAEFSAITATFMLNDSKYAIIKKNFQTQNLWGEEFVSIENEMRFCELPID